MQTRPRQDHSSTSLNIALILNTGGTRILTGDRLTLLQRHAVIGAVQH